MILDDNQVFSERSSTRNTIRDLPSRASSHRTLPRINTSRTSTTSTTDISITNESNLPTVPEIILNKNINNSTNHYNNKFNLVIG